MPQYAISLVVKRLARIPLWSLWSSNLMVFWWSLAVDHTWQSRLKSFLQEFLETRTSSVTNSECEVGWMMDASVKTTNRWTMTHLIFTEITDVSWWKHGYVGYVSPVLHEMDLGWSRHSCEHSLHGQDGFPVITLREQYETNATLVALRFPVRFPVNSSVWYDNDISII